MFMKQFTIPLFISFLLFCSTSSADSPITATNFHKAYLDVKIVKEASETQLLTRKMAEYLVDPSNPIDLKAALINALSWEKNAEKNFKYFAQFISEYHQTSVEELRLKELNGGELLCLGYLGVIGKYFNPLDYISLMKLAKEKTGKSFTVTVLFGLVEAQIAQLASSSVLYEKAEEEARRIYKESGIVEITNEQIEVIKERALVASIVSLSGSNSGLYGTYECLAWLTVEEVFNDKNLIQDMRAEARQIIFDYMSGYKRACDGAEDYWKVSNTRG